MDDPTDLRRVAPALIDPIEANAAALEADLDWLSRVLDARLRRHFGADEAAPAPLDIPPPPLEQSPSQWAEFVRAHALPPAARLVALLALCPHVRPQLLDVLFTRNEATGRGLTEVGGMAAGAHGGMVPTGETAVFLLSGADLAARFQATRLFEPTGILAHSGAVRLGPVAGLAEPALSGPLLFSVELLPRVTTGAAPRPTGSHDFPARFIRTDLSLADLVLPGSTLDQIEEISRWMKHGNALLHDWGMKHRLSPGFTCLFHGPPGTGKTLSACLIGKHCGADVYKIDLSMIVSKYIGETEKNLAKVFDQAEHKGWILFFDEADALFGKRTRVDDARDRYANQEISFLLQRIEEFDGVVILASNLKSNIDDAFLRRFQAVVQFPMPRPPERLRLWREGIPRKARLDERVDLGGLAERHELSGGTILNVVRYAALLALSRGNATILFEDIEEGVRRELLKEGRVA